jgi:hypothetical protein
VCILAVAAAGYAAFGTSVSEKTDQIKQVDAVVSSSTEQGTISSSVDWKKQFLTGSTTIKTSGTAEKTVPSEPDTLTGQFGKKFFEQYMYLKQNNLSEDPQAIKALVDQTTNNLVDAAPQARVYDIREINISTSQDSGLERVYANAIGTIFSAHMPTSDAATVALQALEDEDPSQIKTVESIASSYDAILTGILSVPAPQSLATFHVNLVNGVSAIAFGSHGMTKVFTDPIQSIAALATYEKSLGQLRDGLLDLKFVFAQHNLQFSSAEPAIIFSMIK